jgi:hypothetical protein
MFIIYGKRFYGTADHAPGLFYVASLFFHVWYIPFVPLGAYLLIDDGTGENGVTIGFSGKSFLLGWFRATCYVLGPALLLFGILLAFNQPNVASSDWITFTVWMAAAGAAIIGLLVWSYFWIRIGRERAVALAERAGLDSTFVHDHFDRLEGKPHRGPIDDGRMQDALRRFNKFNTNENIQ